VVLAGLLSILGTWVPAASPAASAAASWAPVHAGDFPDPSVLLYQGTYYAFATQSFAPAGDGINIQESTSTNGVTWSALGTDALPQLPAWAELGDTWAPSVAYNGSHFVMYYAATQTSNGYQCIGMAIASSPEGPYVDSSSAPAVCQDGTDNEGTSAPGNYGGSIDPDIFTDNGVSTLIWKSDGNHIGSPTYLWSQPLTSALTLSGSGPTQLMGDDEPWQGGIVEGPDMVDHDGTDYLFYSGGDEGSAGYSIGYAICPGGPSAPCTDASAADNPILTSAPGMSGPGGPSVFSLPASSNQLVLAFAAWQGTTIGYLSCGIRPMYLADLTFGTGADGVPQLGPATSTGAASSPACAVRPPGYWQVAADGGVFTFGSAQFYGSTGSVRLNKPVVGMAATPDGKGYWLVASDGGVFTFGDAQFYGSTGSMRLNKPIVGMVPTIDGRGYWLVASDGGIFTFGDATFYGSTGGQTLAYPITAMAPGYLGGGYWLVDSNGQVFPFGDTKNVGQPPFAPGGYAITGMAATVDTDGYWLASANGNVANFGDAPPDGSMIGHTLNAPVVGLSATPDGGGYWLQGSDGGIFTFGDALFKGSMGGTRLNAPMVGIASV
jgi:GH43 family beta-xylosidase